MPKETQRTISTWAEDTFGPAGTNLSCAQRAAEEMTELITLLEAGDGASPEDAAAAREEIADIFIVLYRLMTRLDSTVAFEINQKMVKNRKRKWVLRGDGHGSHVEEPEETVAPTPASMPNTGAK